MLVVSTCRADVSGGRFSPYRSDSEQQTCLINHDNEDDTHSVTVLADSVWSSPSSPVKPSTAMYHSLALAGWGQFDNGKKYKALMFIAAEAFCIGGFAYLQYKIGDDDLSAIDKDMHRTNRNSYILYWMAAKVFGLMDAYVDAHLAAYDVTDITPEELER